MPRTADAIGEYGYQVVNSVVCSIGFISRILVDAKRKWTAIEKKCYALHMNLII